MTEATAFESWAVLELMGHRRLAGVVSEAEIAGAGFIRIDVYANGDVEPRSTAYYGPASVYAITPTAEETCRTHATPWSERLQLPEGTAIEFDDRDIQLTAVDEHMDELESEDRAIAKDDDEDLPF